jgi:hypothetical protein
MLFGIYALISPFCVNYWHRNKLGTFALIMLLHFHKMIMDKGNRCIQKLGKHVNSIPHKYRQKTKNSVLQDFILN